MQQIISLSALNSVKKLLKQNPTSSDPTDRTFPRIDRRILIGKYYPVEQYESFYDAVSCLLETLNCALKTRDKTSPLVSDMQRAKQDFTTLCSIYLDNPENNELNSVVSAVNTEA